MAREREQKQPERPTPPTAEEEKVILEDLDKRLNPKGITLKTWGRA